MNIHELKIGNWVKTCLPDMKIMVPHYEALVQGLGGRGVQFDEDYMQEGFWMNPNHVVGIELTAEWLEKLGFETEGHIKDTVFYSKGRLLVTEHWHSGKWGNFYLEFSRGDYYRNIRFVHQLQNLLQALEP